jgi:hypothetical protein
MATVWLDRVMSMKSSNDTIRNRTCFIPDCSVNSQLFTPLCFLGQSVSNPFSSRAACCCCHVQPVLASWIWRHDSVSWAVQRKKFLGVYEVIYCRLISYLLCFHMRCLLQELLQAFHTTLLLRNSPSLLPLSEKILYHRQETFLVSLLQDTYTTGHSLLVLNILVFPVTRKVIKFHFT